MQVVKRYSHEERGVAKRANISRTEKEASFMRAKIMPMGLDTMIITKSSLLKPITVSTSIVFKNYYNNLNLFP